MDVIARVQSSICTACNTVTTDVNTIKSLSAAQPQ